MFKIVNGLTPSYLCHIFQDISHVDVRYHLRREGNIRVPFARTQTYKLFFFPYGIQIWNNLNAHTTNLPSLAEFKLRFKPATSFKEILYYGERLASIHHGRIFG